MKNEKVSDKAPGLSGLTNNMLNNLSQDALWTSSLS